MSKTIVVTGASQGIGYQTVQILIEQGHSILAISRNTTSLEAINNPNLHILGLDLSDMNNFEKIASYVNTHLPKIDGVIHNAGYLVKKKFEETTYQDFEMVYKVNVFAVAELTKILAPHLSDSSHVVTISSIGGVQGSLKFEELAAYSSSKGALITLTELLATVEDYQKRHISFNTLALGSVNTEMLQKAFPGYEASFQTKEIAIYVADFCLYQGHLFNGKVIPIANSTP